MRVLIGSLVLVVASLGSACTTERCADIEAREIGGVYQLDSELEQESPSGARLIGAELEASQEYVVVRYEDESGATFRARYRVKSRRTNP